MNIHHGNNIVILNVIILCFTNAYGAQIIRGIHNLVSSSYRLFHRSQNGGIFKSNFGEYDVELSFKELANNRIDHVYTRCLNNSFATLTFDDGIDP